MGNELLKVEHLQTIFKKDGKVVNAVGDVSFTVNEGEVFGLIGESGCGKSVTCRSLIGLIQPPGKIINGSIMYKGHELVGLGKRKWTTVRGHEIGMIFQEPMATLNPIVKIRTQLTESMKDKGMTKKQKEERGIELLRMVGISSPETRMDCYPHEFSGGMRQRAMIAIALAANPHLLLADEPTTALDVTIQDQIIKLMMKLRKELNMSMILVTHDMGVAAQMCDRIAVMYAGYIMEQADIGEIFSKPRHPYTYGLMSSLPNSEKKGEKLNSIKGAPPNLYDMPSGCPFHPRCSYCEEICKKKFPEMQEVSPGHFSRCHFIDKMKDVESVIEKAKGGSGHE